MKTKVKIRNNNKTNIVIHIYITHIDTSKKTHKKPFYVKFLWWEKSNKKQQKKLTF